MLRYSAVIIARNEERYIEKSIDSLLNQSIKPYRVIVVDDGSVDSTPDILGRMQVTVKTIPHNDRDVSVYSNTLSEIRNVGLACVRDDPVDWVYSGDADVLLPPKYCERIMEHAKENGACIGSGMVRNTSAPSNYAGGAENVDNALHRDVVTLPSDTCRMIRHDWLKSVGMKTKWESVYLCTLALTHGQNTLVRYSSDCIVVLQKPSGGYKPSRQYQKGRLARRMGMSFHLMLYNTAVRTRKRGLKAGYMFCRGWFRENTEVPKEIENVYRTIISGNVTRRIRRHHTMLDIRGMNLICHPP